MFFFSSAAGMSTHSLTVCYYIGHVPLLAMYTQYVFLYIIYSSAEVIMNSILSEIKYYRYLRTCSRKECAAYMVGLPVPFRYEYLMAETVFSQVCSLSSRFV